MAKAKKSLAEAVKSPVRIEERPFIAPKNWEWARLIQIYKFIDYRGKTPTKVSEGIPLITAKNVKMGYLDYSISEFISEEEYTERQGRGISKKGDILFTTEAPMGNVALADLDIYSGGQRLITFQKYDEANLYENRFYYYYILSEWFQRELQINKTGTTVDGIKAEKLMYFPVPLPPIEEQRRIVNVIDEMFFRLNEAKEKAQFVIDQYKDRRASIIHRAYIGEVSALWRELHKVDFSTWKMMTIKDICTSLKYGTSQKSQKEGKVIVIRMGNLQEGEIDWTNLAYTDDEGDIKKYSLEKNDVLFNRTNSPEWVGKTSIYRGENQAIYAGYLIKLDYDHDIINGEYLNYMLNSPKAKEYCNLVKTDGVNQSNINAQKIGAFSIPVPTLNEQKEIVSIVNGLLEKEKQIKTLSENVVEKIDLMKKSILTKALSGQLETNNKVDSTIKSIDQLISVV